MKKGKNVTVDESLIPSFIDRAWDAIRGSADDLRKLGLTVAVHNDYRFDGQPYTFWLMTLTVDGKTIAYKGEGRTDALALDTIRAAHAKDTDNLHHAPMCPANHYEGQRAPTGPCSCGAVEMAKEQR